LLVGIAYFLLVIWVLRSGPQMAGESEAIGKNRGSAWGIFRSRSGGAGWPKRQKEEKPYYSFVSRADHRK